MLRANTSFTIRGDTLAKLWFTLAGVLSSVFLGFFCYFFATALREGAVILHADGGMPLEVYVAFPLLIGSLLSETVYLWRRPASKH